MRYVYLILSLLLISSLTSANPAYLKPFETDGCTFFAEGTPKRPHLWKHCCFEHDLRYWFGGSSQEMDFSDSALRQCVRSVAGTFWANLIYKGVRSGHHSPVRHRLHWGWGWSPQRGSDALTTDEKVIIRQNLYQLDLHPEYRYYFIKKYRLD